MFAFEDQGLKYSVKVLIACIYLVTPACLFKIKTVARSGVSYIADVTKTIIQVIA